MQAIIWPSAVVTALIVCAGTTWAVYSATVGSEPSPESSMFGSFVAAGTHTAAAYRSARSRWDLLDHVLRRSAALGVALPEGFVGSQDGGNVGAGQIGLGPHPTSHG